MAWKPAGRPRLPGRVLRTAGLPPGGPPRLRGLPRLSGVAGVPGAAAGVPDVTGEPDVTGLSGAGRLPDQRGDHRAARLPRTGQRRVRHAGDQSGPGRFTAGQRRRRGPHRVRGADATWAGAWPYARGLAAARPWPAGRDDHRAAGCGGGDHRGHPGRGVAAAAGVTGDRGGRDTPLRGQHEHRRPAPGRNSTRSTAP